MSVSRLHHGCPRREAHPKVVQGATASHHQSADALLPEAEPVLDDAATLDMAVDMCDLHRRWLSAWFASCCSHVGSAIHGCAVKTVRGETPDLATRPALGWP